MKKQILCTGILIASIITSGVAFSKQAIETINVTYDNIKIMIDGKEYQPKDANGNAVEPFIYQGTTYLPVRAIANAFDKDVDWEALTSTVTLGTKNYDWLDQMGYVDYETTSVRSTLKPIPAGTTSNGIRYDRGLKFELRTNEYQKDNDGSIYSYQDVEYLLNGKYRTFSGTFISLCNEWDDQGIIVKIYGDGEHIYTSPIIAYGAKATEFNIDVSDYKILKIHVEIPKLYAQESWRTVTIGIADARLSKK